MYLFAAAFFYIYICSNKELFFFFFFLPSDLLNIQLLNADKGCSLIREGALIESARYSCPTKEGS